MYFFTAKHQMQPSVDHSQVRHADKASYSCAMAIDCCDRSHQGQARVMMLRLAPWETSLSGVEVSMMQLTSRMPWPF